MLMSVEDVRSAVDGSYVVRPHNHEKMVRDITWDSREVVRDGAYLAIVGEKVDGHSFAAQAINDGACCVLVTHDVDGSCLIAAREHDAAIIEIKEPERALCDLARVWRTHLKGCVIGVTGSSGKTSTKNLIATVLSHHMSVVATEANQNNELGVPRTLLRAQEDTQAVVVEMGMRGVGQITHLCEFVKPDMAVITNVGTAHIELLGSRENIACAKGEIVEALPANNGVAFLNAADDYTDFIESHTDAAARGIRIIRFGGDDPASQHTCPHSDVFARDISFDAQGKPSFTLCTPEGSAACTLDLSGAHNVQNACAAAAVACELGMTPNEIAQALKSAHSVAGRQDVHHTESGITVIDDSYNANPDSMKASLTTFASMQVKGRRVAVLGDMGELGDHAPALHVQVGIDAAHAKLDLLVCVGDLARGIVQGARDAGLPERDIISCSCADDALAIVSTYVRPQDAVLVKASHSMGLENVVKGLIR